MCEEFLNEYKILEHNVKDLSGQNIFEYENTLSTDDREKLKVCRILRNYLQHHNDSDDFISINKGMVDYIRSLNIEFDKQYQHVSDKLKKLKAIALDTLLQDSAQQLIKYDYIPVLNNDKNVIAVFDKNMLNQVVALGAKPTTKFKALIKDNEKLFNKSTSGYLFAKAEERLSRYHESNKIIVVDNNDCYKGVVIW